MESPPYVPGGDEPAALDALARWDELPPEELERLAADPAHGERLETLRRAEAWLREQALDGRETDVEACPSPDELYDYGRGPGFTPLTAERRAALDAHMRGCLDCDLLVTSLAARPPLPLELVAEPVGEAEPPRNGSEHVAGPFTGEPFLAEAPELTGATPAAGRPARRRLRLLAPLAAAAALLALLPVWRGEGTLEAGPADGLGLPTAPVLRGDARDPLLFPRGRMLAAPRSAALPAWLDLPALRRFELAPVEGADTYRVELFGHFGGAFDEGRRLARHTDARPIVDVAAVLGSPLPVGHYTWEAWSTTQELEQRLGARDFEVVADEDLWRVVLGLLGEPSDGGRPTERRLARAVSALHEAGFATDARALARELPPSAERDAYLARRPGR